MPAFIRIFCASALIFLGAMGASGPSAHAEEASPADQEAVRIVIEDQLSAFKANDDIRAFSHAAPSIKQLFGSVDRFMTMVKRGYQPIYKSGSHYFGRNDQREQRVAQEVIVTDGNGKQWQAIYILERQADGSWKIAGVRMNPHTGAST